MNNKIKTNLMVVLAALCIMSIIITAILGSIYYLGKNKRTVDETQYQFTVTDSTIEVWNNDTYVGTVKLQGQLDSLLVDYNE